MKVKTFYNHNGISITHGEKKIDITYEEAKQLSCDLENLSVAEEESSGETESIGIPIDSSFKVVR